MKPEPFVIAGNTVGPGTRREIGLAMSRLVTGAEITLPVLVLHGRRPGPTMWIDAALHGDEVCGVEIIRRVLKQLKPASMRGTVIAIPIVNIYGFMNGDRYLPDRRDLNRCFPGSARGSLGSQVAHLLMTEVVARCDVGIDLHTGSDHRSNLPQIRADLDDGPTCELARIFGAPVMIHAQTRDGSLRQAARDVGARVLLYEGGEAWRFDEEAISAGVAGVLRVLNHIGITAADLNGTRASVESRESRRTRWARATRSGVLRLDAQIGSDVKRGERLGAIYNSFGREQSRVRAPTNGVMIGRSEAPLVNRGDAVVHIAEMRTDNGT